MEDVKYQQMIQHKRSYLSEFQQKLTKHFKNKIDNKDDHHVLIYSNPKSSNIYISYTPKWLVDHNDNTGDIVPPQTIIILGVYDEEKGQLIKLVNTQFIHAQRFTDKQYLLNFNYRNKNGMNNTEQHQLKHDLRTNFNIELQKDGSLVSLVDDKPVVSMSNLIHALQYLNKNGYQYLVSVHDVKKQVYADIESEQEGIKEAKAKLTQDSRKYMPHTKSKKKKSNLPKAPGRTTSGYSSISGTKWSSDAKKEAKEKHERKSKNMVNNQNSKSTPKKFSLVNKYVATSGRFNRPLKQIRSLISKNGGIPQRLLTQQTAYLVCDKPNKTKKYKTALKWGIPVIPESKLN